VDNILACVASGPEFVLRIPRYLTSASLARQRHLLNEMYNMKWCPTWLPAVKFDSCNNLLSSIHTMSVIILQLWQFEN